MFVCASVVVANGLGGGGGVYRFRTPPVDFTDMFVVVFAHCSSWSSRNKKTCYGRFYRVLPTDQPLSSRFELLR